MGCLADGWTNRDKKDCSLTGRIQMDRKREIDKQAGRQAVELTDRRWAVWQTEGRQTNRQTGRQTGSKADIWWAGTHVQMDSYVQHVKAYPRTLAFLLAVCQREM